MEVAKTILEQMGGTGRLVAMVGGRNFTGHTQEPKGVSFRFAARSKNKSNTCRVLYDRGSDTYSFELLSIRGASSRVVYTADDVYADMLVRLFETETGLYLSL